MKTPLFLVLTLFVVDSATFGAEGQSAQEGHASRYENFLTNVTLQLNDPYVFEDSLDSFKKLEDYNPDTMARVLVSLAERGVTSTNVDDLRMAKASINAIGYMMLTNTLPYLWRWTLENQQVAISSFDAYGQIAGFDERYLELGQKAVNTGTLAPWFVRAQIKGLLSLDNRLANGQKLPQYYRLKGNVRCKMAQTLLDNTGLSFESCIGNEETLSRCLDGYTNSLEHVRAQRRINEFLVRDKEPIIQSSACRTMDGNWKLSDDEWYRRATNACQSEIARVMALPENERLNMTAILDARIAAIEAAEARAARHAAWKRRLRLGALVLPVPVIALAAIVALTLRRRRAR